MSNGHRISLGETIYLKSLEYVPIQIFVSKIFSLAC